MKFPSGQKRNKAILSVKDSGIYSEGRYKSQREYFAESLQFVFYVLWLSNVKNIWIKEHSIHFQKYNFVLISP